MAMTSTEWVQIICALAIPLSIVGLFIQRFYAKKDIGVRVIQFIAVSAFMPGIIILALADKVDASTVAALIGAFIGYLFSSISKFDDK